MNIIKNMKSKNRKENMNADLTADLNKLNRMQKNLDSNNSRGRFDSQGERQAGEKAGEVYCKYFLNKDSND